MHILRDLFRYCEMSYTEPKVQDSLSLLAPVERARIQRATCLQTRTDYAYACHSNDKCIIAFRGTDSRGGNIKAWVSNLMALDNPRDKRDVGIADGFADFAFTYAPWVEENVRAAKDKEIYLTGHSRGAAAAIISAMILEEKNFLPVVFAYGCPNVCSQKVAVRFESTAIQCTRINTQYDIVSSLPPASLGFCAPGELITLRENFWLPFPPMGNPMRIARGIHSHKPETYRELLNKQFSSEG